MVFCDQGSQSDSIQSVDHGAAKYPQHGQPSWIENIRQLSTETTCRPLRELSVVPRILCGTAKCAKSKPYAL